ncbi:glycine cleavage system protein GcvH [Yaniella flava]|uniref:Glycine cleavage system H protein n=1 Tax=Yaniella flava TaxID=287930 RepID=A0ABN2UUC9_9MICC
MTVVKSALRYSPEHEWLNDEDPVRIGITDYAADQLGDVVFAELPEVGDTVTSGEVCGELESTKSVSELYSPVTGTIVEANDDVVQNPERINEDPYGAGWLFTVEVTEEGELLTAEQYAEQTEGTVE